MQAAWDSLNLKIWSQHSNWLRLGRKESVLYRGYVESETHTKRKEELKKIARGNLAGTPRAKE